MRIVGGDEAVGVVRGSGRACRRGLESFEIIDCGGGGGGGIERFGGSLEDDGVVEGRVAALEGFVNALRRFSRCSMVETSDSPGSTCSIRRFLGLKTAAGFTLGSNGFKAGGLLCASTSERGATVIVPRVLVG